MDSWSCTSEEAPPFSGLPPLPSVFREVILSPPSVPGMGQAVAELLEGECPDHQGTLDWLHFEMLRLRQADLLLFNQLCLLALEIQDLKELQQEMESFGKEYLPAEAKDTSTAMQSHSAAAFELTI